MADAALQSKGLFALLQGAGRGLQAGAQGVAGLFQGGPQAPQFPSLAAPVAGEPNFLQKFQEQVQALSPEEGQLLALADNLLKAGIPPEEVAGELAKTVPPETARGLVDMLLAVEAGVAAPPPPGREQLLDEAALLTQNFLFKGGTDEDALDALAQQGAAPEEAEAVVSRARGELAAQEERERVESLLPEFTDPDQEDIARKLLAGTRPSDVVREMLKVPGADKAVAIAQVQEVREALRVEERTKKFAGKVDVPVEEVFALAGEATTPEQRAEVLRLASVSAKPQNFLDLMTGDHRLRQAIAVSKLMERPRVEKTAEELESLAALAALRRQNVAEQERTQEVRDKERQAKLDKLAADTESASARAKRMAALSPAEKARLEAQTKLFLARVKKLAEQEAAGAIPPGKSLQLVIESLRGDADVAGRQLNKVNERLLEIDEIVREAPLTKVTKGAMTFKEFDKLRVQQVIRRSAALAQKPNLEEVKKELIKKLDVINELRNTLAGATTIAEVRSILEPKQKEGRAPGDIVRIIKEEEAATAPPPVQPNPPPRPAPAPPKRPVPPPAKKKSPIDEALGL